MNSQVISFVILLSSCMAAARIPSVATAQQLTVSDTPTLEEVRAAGSLQSSYRKSIPKAKTVEIPKADLETFRAEVEPTLKTACYQCHGSETAEGEFRVDRVHRNLEALKLEMENGLDPNVNDQLHRDIISDASANLTSSSGGGISPLLRAFLTSSHQSASLPWRRSGSNGL